MAEQRFHDFGDFVRAEDQNRAQSVSFSAGVLLGHDITISADAIDIQIAPGAVITEDGVMIDNDTQRTLEFTPQSDPAKFTLVLLHEFSLLQNGRPSSIELREVTSSGSPIFASSIEGGVVLGWVDYPGGTVSVSDDMVFNAPKIRVQAPPTPPPIDYKAPLLTSPGILEEPEDSDVVRTDSLDAKGFPMSTWTNNHGATTKNVTLTFVPDRALDLRPKFASIEFAVNTDPSTSVEVYLNVDGTNTLLDTFNGPLKGESRARVPSSLVTDPIPPLGLKVVVNIPPTESVSISRVFLDASPAPS